MSTPVLELRSISKTFGNTEALKDISLTVEPGSLIVLLGPAGAGKTFLSGKIGIPEDFEISNPETFN